MNSAKKNNKDLLTIPSLTLKAFNKLYKKGYDKMYPDINLVRIEKVFFKKKDYYWILDVVQDKMDYTF